MKRIILGLIVIILCLPLVSCIKPNEGDYYVREDNELYTDLHIGMGPQRRTYSMSYIIGGDPRFKEAEDKSLSEMKRFVFQVGSRHNEGAGLLFALDTHSKRIYSGYDNRNIENVLQCKLIVDLKQNDIDKLIEKLNSVELQKWKKDKVNVRGGRPYSIGIEYDDGSIEVHYVTGEDANITELLTYFERETATFENRMLADRKTTENIDYLISQIGYEWGQDSIQSVPQPISFENIDRISIFEAEGPHEVEDHSRSPQRTLFLDVLNGQLYYEPEKTVYEQITKASVVRELQESETEAIIDLLEGGVTEWKTNVLYWINEENPPSQKLDYISIPAWSIAIQYAEGSIVHFSGDGLGENGWAPGCREVLDALFGAVAI